MQLLMSDPEFFNIEQNKLMGLWPPGDQVAIGVYPYIKRLKTDKVTIVDVGVMKGEGARWFFEMDTVNQKIGMIYGVVSVMEGDKNRYNDLLEKNMSGESRFTLGFDPYKKNQEVDVVCINSECNLDKSLKRFYRSVKPNGIFCGNLHASGKVKEALLKFRRDNKIGTPISVSNGSWFWYKR